MQRPPDESKALIVPSLESSKELVPIRPPVLSYASAGGTLESLHELGLLLELPKKDSLALISGSDEKKRKNRRCSRRTKKAKNGKASPTVAPQRHNQITPSPTKGIAGTYESLKDWQFDPEHVVAMDCEMVGVGEGGKRSILARVSIVNFYGTTLLDKFVKPVDIVTDYRTFVSGIRPQDLNSPDAIEFPTCRFLVQQSLCGKVLVGHGLQNDLSVLQLTHDWYYTRDSATLRPFLRQGNRPRRLKELVAEHLGIGIQHEGKEHCSIEDAQAVMELYKRFQPEWDEAIKAHRNYVLQCPLRKLTPIRDGSIFKANDNRQM